MQAYEYSHAAFSFAGNIYGATFFMATGFHGFHVLVGTIFLIVCLMRAYAGHFTPTQHLGFEFAAWYWHFVDVVWLFLFICIYVWGPGGGRMGGAISLTPTCLQGAAAGPPFLFSKALPARKGRKHMDRRPSPPERDARPRLQMPALRQGQTVFGISDLRPNCEVCGLDYAFIDPGDGPAIFIIMIAGAIVVACALIVEVKYQPPYWLHAVLWLPLILVTTLLPLRAMKSLLIALQFHHKAARRPADRSRSAMTATTGPRRGIAGFAIFTLVMLALFVGLGVWQLQRRTEKHALIAALTERLAAHPQRCRRLRNGAR